jgi:hypothetical protein
MPKKKTTEEFIQEIIIIYGNLYNCDKVDYKGNRVPVIFTCYKHGEFSALPVNMLSKKSTCKECGLDRHTESVKKRTDTTETFITKSNFIHGIKYTYSKVNYVNAKTKVIITCSVHGDFEQTPDMHISRKQGCPKCGGTIRKTTNQFIIDSRKIHGNKFDYSKVIYINCESKVIIICPIHGDYEQRAQDHLNGGCRKCADKYTSNLQRKTTEEFIKDSKLIYGNKYDYSKVKYVNGDTKVIIICPVHGEFEQTPINHYKHDCKSCSAKKTGDNLRKTTEDFINDAIEVHGDKYNYDKTDYKNADNKVIITCLVHGDFEQIANVHLLGKGCPKCGIASMTNLKTKSQEEFINQVENIHGNKYDYSLVEYINSDTDIIIICPKHGNFNQRPRVHLRGGNCPKCTGFKNEMACIEIIEKITEHRFIKCRPSFLDGLELDGYNADIQLAIEYNGEQHYKIIDYFHRNGIYDLLTQVEHDKIKKRKCQENNVYLIIVPYYVQNKEQFIQEKLKLYEEWILSL